MAMIFKSNYILKFENVKQYKNVMNKIIQKVCFLLRIFFLNLIICSWVFRAGTK